MTSPQHGPCVEDELVAGRVNIGFLSLANAHAVCDRRLQGGVSRSSPPFLCPSDGTCGCRQIHPELAGEDVERSPQLARHITRDEGLAARQLNLCFSQFVEAPKKCPTKQRRRLPRIVFGRTRGQANHVFLCNLFDSGKGLSEWLGQLPSPFETAK